jgi:hypothetical protein
MQVQNGSQRSDDIPSLTFQQLMATQATHAKICRCDSQDPRTPDVWRKNCLEMPNAVAWLPDVSNLARPKLVDHDLMTGMEVSSCIQIDQDGVSRCKWTFPIARSHYLRVIE